MHDSTNNGSPVNVMDVELSAFTNITSAMAPPPKTWRLFNILDYIQTDQALATRIGLLRAIYQAEPDRYLKEKRKLAAFCMSGTAKSRTIPLEYSGIIQADCDKLGAKLPEVRSKLESDPHVAFVFLSPSGDGLKAGVRIEGDFASHKESFQEMEAYFQFQHGISVCTSTKDPLRLCFFSHDPNVYRNGAAKPLNGAKSKNVSHIHSSQDTKKTTDTKPTIPLCTLCHTIPQGSPKLEALRQRSGFKKKSPELFRLYETMVERAFPAVPGTRNETLVRAVTMLYRVASKPVLVLLMQRFYELNHSYFNDPIEAHMKEVNVHVAAVEASYPETLSPVERDYYAEYDETEQTAFRILRDLALYTGKGALPPPQFAVSEGHLGTRLGKHPQRSRRLLQAFIRDGVIEIVQKGRPHVKGEPGEGIPGVPTTYRWLLT